MRENIYCLQGCDTAFPTGMYLRFGPRIFPSSGFYLEVAGKFLPDYTTPQPTEKISYTGCPRRNVPDFGRVFLMLKYTDITQNTYIQS